MEYRIAFTARSSHSGDLDIVETYESASRAVVEIERMEGLEYLVVSISDRSGQNLSRVELQELQRAESRNGRPT